MKRKVLDGDGAETIALRSLAFLAGDPDRLARFLALSGVGPQDLRARARAPEMLTAVLEHLLADETLLLMFAGDAGLPPEEVARAHAVLAGDPSH